jgi:hypothetical protein
MGSSDINTGNTGRTLEGIGITVGAVGIAAVAGGIIWHFVEPAGSPKTGTTVTPVISPGYGGLAVGGSF